MPGATDKDQQVGVVSRLAEPADSVESTELAVKPESWLYATAHELQLLTRQQRGFEQLEAALKSYSSGVGGVGGDGSGDGQGMEAIQSPQSSQSSQSSQASHSRRGARSRLGSLAAAIYRAASRAGRAVLGERSPGGGPAAVPEQAVTAKDAVWLLDNVAFPAEEEESIAEQSSNVGNGWRAEYVVAVLSQRPAASIVVADAVRNVADKLGLGPKDEAALRTVEERITPFLQDILPGRVVEARFGAAASDCYALHFRAAGRNGLSSDVVALPAAAAVQPGVLVPTRAVVPEGTSGVLQMQTFFTGASGWGVISDIDDTIKLTQTSDPVGILQKTFVDPAAAIEGMPALYAFLRRRLGADAPFFYLSASPYCLYPFLQQFRQAFYPDGALILRDAELLSVAGLLRTLTLGTQAYKADRMRKLHSWLPGKRFICVGDSTQSDPEAYGELYRAFPDGWIGLILIRKVTDIAALGLAAKNEPARFAQAFAGVPASVWHVFEDPDECYEWVENALES